MIGGTEASDQKQPSLDAGFAAMDSTTMNALSLKTTPTPPQFTGEPPIIATLAAAAPGPPPDNPQQQVRQLIKQALEAPTID